jgi:hypothetical protein
MDGNGRTAYSFVAPVLRGGTGSGPDANGAGAAEDVKTSCRSLGRTDPFHLDTDVSTLLDDVKILFETDMDPAKESSAASDGSRDVLVVALT